MLDAKSRYKALGSIRAMSWPASTAELKSTRISRIIPETWLPTSTVVTALRLPLAETVTARVNRATGSCNAGWDGAELWFVPARNGCANSGEIADLIMHEWGHGLDENTGGGLDRAEQPHRGGAPVGGQRDRQQRLRGPLVQPEPLPLTPV